MSLDEVLSDDYDSDDPDTFYDDEVKPYLRFMGYTPDDLVLYKKLEDVLYEVNVMDSTEIQTDDTTSFIISLMDYQRKEKPTNLDDCRLRVAMLISTHDIDCGLFYTFLAPNQSDPSIVDGQKKLFKLRDKLADILIVPIKITLKVKLPAKATVNQSMPGFRLSDGDYFGKYCGDTYGCGYTGLSDACNKCCKCNPKLYWTERRCVSRPDHPSLTSM